MPTAFTRGADAIVVARELGPTGPIGPTGATGATGPVALGAEIFFTHKAALEAATVASTTKTANIAGYYAFGDSGHGTYKRVAAEPTHALKIRSTDRFMPDGSGPNPTNGGWWELIASGEVYVRQAGGKGDNATDDTAAIQNCIAFLGPAGGTVHLGGGIFVCAGTITIASTIQGLTLEGVGGVSAGAQTATWLRYTGTGLRFIDARSTNGFAIRGCYVGYSNAAFTSNLIDLGSSAYAKIEDSFLTPIFDPAGPGTAKLVDLNATQVVEFQRVVFAGGKPAVRGQDTGSYSVKVTFINCTFKDHVGTAVITGGESWSFIGCVFQQDTLSRPNAFLAASGFRCRGMTWIGNWFGDATAAGTWISVTGDGINYGGFTFVGNFMDGTTTSIAISLIDWKGAFISGNGFDTFANVVEAGGPTCSGIKIDGNQHVNVTNFLGGFANFDAGNCSAENNSPDINGFRSIAVVNLPASAPLGAYRFAFNGRAYNGAGVLEGAGLGTGVGVHWNGSAWKVAGTNQTVQA